MGQHYDQFGSPLRQIWVTTTTNLGHHYDRFGSPLLPIWVTVYDITVRKALQSILNVNISEQTSLQASLPVSYGGLGVRAAKDLALPGFISSASFSLEPSADILPVEISQSQYDDLLSAKQEWLDASSGTPLPNLPEKQSNWDIPINELKLNKLINESDNDQDKARLLSITSEHASDYLNALPCSSLGLKLDKNQLRIAIGLRLGVPICSEFTCKCGEVVDRYGQHPLACKKSAGRFPRHMALNDLIKRSLSTA